MWDFYKIFYSDYTDNGIWRSYINIRDKTFSPQVIKKLM